MDWFYWPLALIGHIGLWCVIFNRTHATAWPRAWRKLIEKAIILVVLLPIGLIGYALAVGNSWSFWNFGRAWPAALVYLLVSVATSLILTSAWILRLWQYRFPSEFCQGEADVYDVEKELKKKLRHGAFARVLSWVPGNQATQVAFENFQVRLPRVNPSRKIRICQLSDFHFTGQIDIAYFRWIIERVNARQPDLVLITGDLVDEASCLDWIGPVFEPLQAPAGKFYLLGNHDRRILDEADLRGRLERAGLQRAGGRWNHVSSGDLNLALAGNELPWYPGAEILPVDPGFAHDWKILISHSPDQIDWADKYGFDLIFAGHTHGGQIRLPLIGPIISPSKYGVRYAGGTFRVGANLMHVSRGICGDEPIRWNCRPEVGFFEILPQH
jgi:hypothetical protein